MQKLGRHVNVRSMTMLTQAEGQYNDLMRKKRIVEDDKAKIENAIVNLDQKKAETLQVPKHKNLLRSTVSRWIQ